MQSLNPSQRINIFGYVLLSVMLLLWFIFKLNAFDALEYTSDLFTHLQISNSWLKGKPLLFENCYGDHSKIHNYYFTVFLSVFTIWSSAYGLFIGHILLLAVAVFLWWRLLSSRFNARAKKWHSLFLLFVLFFGPASFMIWDNPEYGWHSEMLYVPLGILFLYALVVEKKGLILLTALSIVLIKEDGAVLGACITLAFLASKYLKQPSKAQFKHCIKLGVIFTGIWIVIFLLGMLLLSAKNDFNGVRAAEALQHIKTKPSIEIWQFYGPMLFTVLLLLLGTILYIIFNFSFYHALIYLLLLMPVLMVQAVASLYYFPSHVHGLIWVPRMAQYWAFSLCFILICYYFKASASRFKNKDILKSIVFLIILWAGQELFLDRVNQVDTEIRSWEVSQRFIKKLYLHAPPLDEDEKRLKIFSNNIPKQWQVAPPPHYFALFPYQIISWKDHIHNDNVWTYPEVMISESEEDAIFQNEVYKTYKCYAVGRFKVCLNPKADLLFGKRMQDF